MDENIKKPVLPNQTCRIDIIAQVDSDEQAIAIKQKVMAGLADVEKKRVTFSIIAQ